MSRWRGALSGLALLGTVGACGSAPDSSPTPTPEPYAAAQEYLSLTPDRAPDLDHPYVVGKVVIVFKADESPEYPDFAMASPGEIWWLGLDDALLPKRPADVGTVIWLDCQDAPTTTYNNGQPGYSGACELSVIDKAANLLVGTKTFEVGAPFSISCPATGCAGDEGVGWVPTDDIQEYVEGLPRR